ncbi:MAG: tRNA pseudouridine(55) synthase TruB [Alphaproteobacteria bacterium]|nr:tRNA pseudouridine(55) synthase TruB [Alphaproteobacteria bacterium]
MFFVLITSNAQTTGVSRWKANSKPTFSRIGKRSLEGTLDTSGVSRMVLHFVIFFLIFRSSFAISHTMKRTKHQNINGWLIIDKPRGLTSTDVVNQTRRLFDANKNGHTGTLDPFATGVLPIAFGEATKLIPYVMDGNKIYEFTLKFGFSTNTDDIEGTAVQTGGRIPLRQEILEILPSFLGQIEQKPPAYSALKINGERAYKLAREGKDVDISPRLVTIGKLELLDQTHLDAYTFRVECSKGTYVRALGRDIALKLGTFGHLTTLRRTKCGFFCISDTILLENAKKMVYEDCWQDSLWPVSTPLRDIAALAVSAEDAVKLRLGQSLSPKNYDVQSHIGQTMAAYKQDCLTALVRVDERKISPIRVFNL